MNCPVCESVTLAMADRQGIEVDHCPKCRGVWLDRGELDKIIERSTAAADPAALRGPPPRERDRDDDRKRSDDDFDDDSSERGRRRKKKGFLGDIFDF